MITRLQIGFSQASIYPNFQTTSYISFLPQYAYAIR